jgi:hypothetical protein
MGFCPVPMFCETVCAGARKQVEIARAARPGSCEIIDFKTHTGKNACITKSLFLCAPRQLLFNLSHTNFVGQDGILRPIGNRPVSNSGSNTRPITNLPQVTNLPHTIRPIAAKPRCATCCTGILEAAEKL